jgi:TetR/AcrR family tetracycline transcriptional repressor
MMIISAGASGRSRWRLALTSQQLFQDGVPVKRATGELGRRSRPGRGLSLDRIVTATLELVDEQGIGAATMRAVASRLGVRPMSLYRYVQDRDELFDAVVERIVNELADDPEVQLRPVDGWRPYLSGMAHGVRRYARAHPHAFPLVATRPPAAPWVNPPLRSLRWVEAMVSGLAGEGFSDEQVLFTYRTFNSFLLGSLLLETSAMTLRDPKPGDGSFTGTDTASDDGSGPGGGAPAHPVTGGLSPARSAGQRAALGDAGSPRELLDPADEIDARRFPTVHRLAAGLAEDRWEREFQRGLEDMLDRIAMLVADGPNLARE